MSDALKALMAVQAADDARRERAKHPKGFEPGIRFDADGEPEEVTISLREVPENESAWRTEITRVTSLPLPDDKRVTLREVRYWGNPEAPNIYCRFSLDTIKAQASDHDAASFLKSLRKSRARVTPTYDGGTTLCMSWNDWQTGKSEGGGTAALTERFAAQVESAKIRARELRKLNRGLGRLVILGGGDMIEGCTIYPNQSYNIDRDRRGQINDTTTLIEYGLDELAPLFEAVTVLVVGGNHGENRINGNRTTRADNDDCLVFENAARAASRDPRLGHVNFIIAQDEPAKTLDVHGWILATTHGQAFGKGAGSPEAKAWNWYRGQAAGRLAAGDADVLVSHHYHHRASRDWGACLWQQTPANDGGSPQHTDLTGQNAAAGMLTWVMTPESRWQDEAVL